MGLSINTPTGDTSVSKQQKIITLVTNIITAILAAVAGYFGGEMQ